MHLGLHTKQKQAIYQGMADDLYAPDKHIPFEYDQMQYDILLHPHGSTVVHRYGVFICKVSLNMQITHLSDTVPRVQYSTVYTVHTFKVSSDQLL